MRIFQSIEATANASIKGNLTWYRNLYEPLVEMGHDVVLFDATEGRQAYNRKDRHLLTRFSNSLYDKFLSEHKKKPFDLFFSYFIDGMIDPGVIDSIRQANVPACNFSCNNMHQFYLVEVLSKHFDFNLYAEKGAREKFLRIGANAVWFPMASNPAYFKPYDVSRKYDVSFVGANYANRSRYVNHLLEQDIDIHVFGPEWQFGSRSAGMSFLIHYYFLLKCMLAFRREKKRKYSACLAEHDYRWMLAKQHAEKLHAPVSDEKLIRLYSESHISLGFLEVFSRHDPSAEVLRHIHLREFEAPMCRALYMTGYMDELAEHFEPDREIVTYRNMFELVDKARYYLSHPDQAEKVRQAGYERALKDHTYHNRFRSLFKQLGLPG